MNSLAGVSRSASIVIAYLMTVTNFTFRQAMDAVRGARRCVSPNFGFQRQLLEFELENLAKVTFFDFVQNYEYLHHAYSYSTETSIEVVQILVAFDIILTALPCGSTSHRTYFIIEFQVPIAF